MIKKAILLLLMVCLQSCHYGRMIRYYKADIDDHKIFPYTEVNTGENTFYFRYPSFLCKRAAICDGQDFR